MSKLLATSVCFDQIFHGDDENIVYTTKLSDLMYHLRPVAMTLTHNDSMLSSQDDFSDNEDELLVALAAAKKNDNNGAVSSRSSMPEDTNEVEYLKNKLYESEGQVSIIRAQIEHLGKQKQQEINKLKETMEINQFKSEERLKTLKFSVQKLDDEKKFLNNELVAASAIKKRKTVHLPESSSTASKSPFSSGEDRTTASNLSYDTLGIHGAMQDKANLRPHLRLKIIKVQNDVGLFTDYIWNYCINGFPRSTFDYLNKIFTEESIEVGDFRICAKIPLSTAVTEYLMKKKNLRLDEMLKEFCSNLSQVIEIFFERNKILPVPYLASLIFASLTFRPSAISQALVKSMLVFAFSIANRFIFVLDSTQDQEDFISYRDVPHQVMLYEKFTLICIFDIIEKLVVLATSFGPSFVKSIWKEHYIDPNLFMVALPENSERFKRNAQVNLIYNLVEILETSLSEEDDILSNDSHYENDQVFVSSLFKVFLIDIPIRSDLMFYGLNRVSGNNIDSKKIDSTVPQAETILQRSMISIPCPIPHYLHSRYGSSGASEANNLPIEVQVKHESHVYILRLKVANLLESYIVARSSTDLFQLKEVVKAIVRIIGNEQVYIIRFPRAKTVYLRVQIITSLVRILNYISSEVPAFSTIIYPETLYELFVILLRIAFASNELSIDANKLLVNLRSKKFYGGTVFNEQCEKKAREINHIAYSDLHTSGRAVADYESDVANGLEFPYDTDTIELAREILDLCVTHEEADNLYLNMTADEIDFGEANMMLD